MPQVQCRQAPVVTYHRGVAVVRDDLFPGGTKARYIADAFVGADTVVYASPCEGGAQVALAHVARQLGKTAVIVCAQRRVRHRRTDEAASLGARIVEICGMAMFNVVQARARELATREGLQLAPFGLNIPQAAESIRDAALSTGLRPAEVWCAAGSGLLARGLALAWPSAKRNVLQVGHKLTAEDVSGATIHRTHWPYSKAINNADFPSDPHYEAKAWSVCCERHGDGLILFWNVTGSTYGYAV